MGLFAVNREAGPAWTAGKSSAEQPGRPDHVAFMEGLAAQGIVVFAGSLAGSHRDRIRVLSLVEATSDAEVRRRLAEDPWEQSGQIVTTRIETWTLRLGADRWPPAE